MRLRHTVMHCWWFVDGAAELLCVFAVVERLPPVRCQARTWFVATLLVCRPHAAGCLRSALPGAAEQQRGQGEWASDGLATWTRCRAPQSMAFKRPLVRPLRCALLLFQIHGGNSNAAVQVEGSLLHFLDRAATPAGRRKVRQFIANPLFRCSALLASCPCWCTNRCAVAAGRQLAFLQAYAAAWPTLPPAA